MGSFNWKRKDTPQEAKQSQQDATENSDSTPPTETGLLLGTVDDPLLIVTACLPSAAESPALALPREAHAALNGMLQVLPLASIAAPSGAYMLQFAPHISSQLATGHATLMQALDGGVRSIAIDAQGKIIGHGTLIPATGINPIFTVAAIWKVAAVATAQYYLVAMQRQLHRIEALVEELQQWLDDREVARLVTDARLLQNLFITHSAVVASESLLPMVTQTLSIAQHAAHVAEARRMSLVRKVEQARTQPLGDLMWWDVEQNVTAYNETIRAADHDLRVGTLALAVWATALQLHTTLGGMAAHADTERQHIAEIRTKLSDAHRLVGDVALNRIDNLQNLVDPRNVLLNLQVMTRITVAASNHQRSANLAMIERALLYDGTSHAAAADAPSHQLVARRHANGSWELASYVRPIATARPAAEQITADVINRLWLLPNLELAKLEYARYARPRMQLCNRTSLHTWRNFLGVNHVFLVDDTGRAIFGGFVLTGNAALEDTIQEIGRRYG
ncbi:hypothetical protein [Candidatus Viridilinea mediisalina]|uniref:Uncharacterized protein n=1 Tax=Candidatus Viridilinea mediisalina TaxID=2024553 RepID=A0A2A6RG69_9CHLR|nr:hypothetical protein [Candidatus Viridilinea mediisalina]PDW01931.1 hypothetical protein CJ255_16570 [Candidatus Viridilinea mediisalina]